MRKIDSDRVVILAAGSFWLLVLAFSLHRYWSGYANTDHAIFAQVFWNNLHRNWFESSLSSTLSANVIHNGEVPRVDYQRLGQHFTPALLLWLPFYALLPSPTTLNLIQVSLMAIAGLVLYGLAKQTLKPPLAAAIALSYYGANAVIGPSLGNFFDLCQIPLYTFSLLWAKQKGKWWLVWLLAALIVSVREDAGVILFSLGFYWLVSRDAPRLGIGLCIFSFGYMLLITSVVMPLFSTDISQRFMIERFGQYVESDSATTPEIIWAIATQPKLVLQELVTPWGQKLNYLLGHWLPLAFIPAISPAAWLSSSFPLLQLFLQQGDSRLAINIRYAVALVPGIFYGAILWWTQHQHQFRGKLKQFWYFCIGLSLFFTFTSNPHRAWFFIVPDSIDPWVYKPITVQWQHIQQLKPLLDQIPKDASVSATRYILPRLANRRQLLRFPQHIQLQTETATVNVEYIIADLWQLREGQAASNNERRELITVTAIIDRLLIDQEYGIADFGQGIVLLQHQTTSQPQAQVAWQAWRQELQPILLP